MCTGRCVNMVVEVFGSCLLIALIFSVMKGSEDRKEVWVFEKSESVKRLSSRVGNGMILGN